jgi:hypothetical protein
VIFTKRGLYPAVQEKCGLAAKWEAKGREEGLENKKNPEITPRLNSYVVLVIPKSPLTGSRGSFRLNLTYKNFT